MKPTRTSVAQAMQSASSYAFHELESLLVCAQSTVGPLIDELAAEKTAMDQAAVNRMLDALLVLDTAFDVIRERLDERRDAIEAIYYGHVRPDDVAFLVRPARRLARGKRGSEPSS